MGVTRDHREWATCLEETSTFKSLHILHQFFYANIRGKGLVEDGSKVITVDNFLKKIAPKTLSGVKHIKKNDGSFIWREMDMSLHDNVANVLPTLQPISFGKSDNTDPAVADFNGYLRAVEEVYALQKSFDNEQLDAIQQIMTAIRRVVGNQSNDQGEVNHSAEDPMTNRQPFFTDGPGTTGKSHLYNTLIAKT
ncbi:hypothetical protein BGW42_003694 [Actinomortierella wolfii]|nr:hypothetical protein BGW42_003694 [Actinomortierella wolfii]